MKKGLFLISFLAFIFSCTSLQTASNNKQILTHEISYTAKGTKSEGQIGKLKVNGVYIPAIFSYVTDGKATYKFIVNNQKWGKHEYFPMEQKLNINQSSELISAKDMENGFYLGVAKKKNTPNTWLKVQWDGGDAFIDSSKISLILNKEPFKSLKNYSELNNILKI